jgi:hypothetical protein
MLILGLFVLAAGYLGYQRREWWMPAAVAAGFVVLQLVVYSGTGGAWRHDAGLQALPVGPLALSTLAVDLVVAYIAYGAGVVLAKWQQPGA